MLMILERASGEVVAEGIENETVQVCEGNWYFDPRAVNMEYLRVTERTYHCPYKGTCYWIDLQSPTIYAQNVAWIYDNPKSGWEHIKDQIGMYSHDTAGTVAMTAVTT